MNNPHQFQDDDIVNLLADLNNAEKVDYPVELRDKRRAAFMTLVSNLAPTHSNSPVQPDTPNSTHALYKSNLLQFISSIPAHFIAIAALIIAVVGMAIAIYVYRENIRTWLLPISPTATVAAPLQTFPLLSSATPQPSPTLTISPTTVMELPQSSATVENRTYYPTATLNSGLHLGNTKTPKPGQVNKTPEPKSPLGAKTPPAATKKP